MFWVLEGEMEEKEGKYFVVNTLLTVFFFFLKNNHPGSEKHFREVFEKLISLGGKKNQLNFCFVMRLSSAATNT